ncbi:MAG TPA: MFS transporter [Patescibacteria group bacterium]|nr:MFS transporter [Patescibacteria group bacterium]
MQKNSRWIIFFLVAVAQFMVILDVSITNVALPTIKQALHFSTNNLQWVITAYALTFGGFLLLGGRAADLFGRKRILLIGMSSFTLFSFLIGISNSAVVLIILRALQGIAAALMSPAALSIVLTTFKEGEERNKALGYWTTVATGGSAVGLLLGGALTQFFGWRWNFFINVPIGIFVSIAIARIIPSLSEKQNTHRDLDLPGAALLTGGLILFVFSISQAPVWGWLSTITIGLFAVVIILITAFIINELLSKHPIIPLTIFKIRNVTGANLMLAPIVAGMYGMFFLTSLYIQTVLHYSPVLTGLSFLPFPIILGITSTRIAHFVTKYGYRRFLIAGPLLIAIGVAWLSRLPVNGNYFINILPTILLMPVGIGMTFLPIIVAATAGVPANRSGLASGLINTSQQMGGAIGLTVLSSVAASVTLATAYTGQTQALVNGYDRAFLVGVILILLAAVLGVIIISQKRPPSNQRESAGSLESENVVLQ